ncbi:MAG: acyl-[acyl-carrier-protein]--UDP-N-acetylglucosamine O-acyltransferase, partial [Lentisphaeria bacterium]|nr:acyl-[acyl-carrier-protein]--UDP-N-acetylglucosamine O-acyltransferase [Lentisphaeria bacterium]
MAKIHPTAVVEDGAILGDGVEIGPLCYVGPNVKIGDGTRLIAHCNVDGYTTLGKNNVLHPFAALGQPAQDHSVVPGAATYLNVGDNNIFREGTA